MPGPGYRRATDALRVRYTFRGSPRTLRPKNGLFVCASGKLKTAFWTLADPNALLKVNIT